MSHSTIQNKKLILRSNLLIKLSHYASEKWKAFFENSGICEFKFVYELSSLGI